jgi:hypothetical protein
MPEHVRLDAGNVNEIVVFGEVSSHSENGLCMVLKDRGSRTMAVITRWLPVLDQGCMQNV